MIGEVVTGLVGIGKKVAGGIFGDKAAVQRFEAEYENAMLKEGSAILQKELDAQAQILAAELQGDKWQRRWRPTLMYAIIGIIINNYILQPYMAGIFNWSVTLDLPSQLWNLMTIGVGGYIGGRSLEKLAKNLNLKK